MKKITTILFLTLLFFISVLLTGCNKEQAESTDNTSINVTNVFKPVFASLPQDDNINYINFFTADNRIYINYQIIVSNKVESMLFSVDLNGEDTQNILASVNEPDKSTITHVFTTDKDGNKISIEYKDMSADKTFKYILMKSSMDGQIIFETDITNIFDEDTVNNSTESFYLMATDSVHGNTYLARENIVAAISPSGEKLFEITVPKYINRLSGMSDGRILVVYGDKYTYNYSYGIIDPSTESLTTDIKIPSADSLTGYDIYSGDGYDLYFKTREALYGYNYSNNSTTEVCNWINSGIDGSGINDIIILSPDKLAVFCTDNITLQKQIAVLTRTPDSRIISKKIIKMAYISQFTDPFWTATVVYFNSHNENYQIVLEDYSKYNSVVNDTTGLDKLQKDILTDKAPDILLHDPSISVESLSEKGAFADIYELMEDDSGFSRDNLLGYATAPFEIGGKLYSLPLCVSIWTRAAEHSFLGDKNNWTLEDMYACSQTIAASGNAIFPPHITKLNLFNELIKTNITAFVDKNNKTCAFDSEVFVKLLEYCNTYPDSVPTQEMMEFQMNQTELYRSGKIKVYFLTMDSFSSYLYGKYVFGTDHISLIGLPAPSDSGNSAIVFPTARISVSAKSTAKDGIREYIKYLLSDRIQTSQQIKHLPVTLSGLKAHTDYYLSKYCYFQMNGANIPYTVNKDENNNPYEDNPKLYYKTELTQADADYLTEYFNSIKISYDSNKSIIDIADEEAQAYFAGDKSIAEVTKIIQSRAGVYLGEKN